LRAGQTLQAESGLKLEQEALRYAGAILRNASREEYFTSGIEALRAAEAAIRSPVTGAKRDSLPSVPCHPEPLRPQAGYFSLLPSKAWT
jgi:hypothetical protein